MSSFNENVASVMLELLEENCAMQRLLNSAALIVEKSSRALSAQLAGGSEANGSEREGDSAAAVCPQ
jgi:hypothetical protein